MAQKKPLTTGQKVLGCFGVSVLISLGMLAALFVFIIGVCSK